MKLGNTEMYMVTFAIIVFELVMLFFLVFYFLQRTSDRKRLLSMILLIFLLLYNICSGLFPDERIPIPIPLQVNVEFLVGFTMSMYFVYYFYKAFDLAQLKFFASYGSLFFLFFPFAFLFVIPYLVTGDVNLSKQLAVVIPFLYGLAFIYATSRAFYLKFKEARGFNEGDDLEHSIELIVAAYVALLCWAALPVIVFFGDFQVLEHCVTNAGFLMMTIIYVRTSIRRSHEEFGRLQRYQLNLQEVIESNCTKYGLTPRETEIIFNIIKGSPYKIIALELSISEKTVARHVSNIFTKAAVTNKIELIKKMEKR